MKSSTWPYSRLAVEITRAHKRAAELWAGSAFDGAVLLPSRLLARSNQSRVPTPLRPSRKGDRLHTESRRWNFRAAQAYDWPTFPRTDVWDCDAPDAESLEDLDYARDRIFE